jgi:hypothetical protein
MLLTKSVCVINIDALTQKAENTNVSTCTTSVNSDFRAVSVWIGLRIYLGNPLGM